MKESAKDTKNGWYVQVPSGKGYMLLRGPYSNDDIKGLWNAGDVTPTTLVRYGTDEHWKQIQDITHFSSFAGERPSNNTVVWRINR